MAYHVHFTYLVADFYARRWRRRLVAILQATFYQTGDHRWSCVFVGYHGTFPAVFATTKTGYLYGKSDQLEFARTFPPVYLVTKLGVFFKKRHVVALFVATKAGTLSPNMSTVL